MSGHSKWSSIKHKKGAKDARRGKLFSKLIREITVAAKMGGGELDANPRLRQAINNARAANLPQDTAMRAVTKGAGGADGVDYAEVIYEGYGPHNAAVVIEALTDNRNRTASSIRSTFSKYDGNLGASNSVLFMFDHVGTIVIDRSAIDEDTLTDYVLEAGGEDLESGDEGYIVSTRLEAFEPVKSFLESKGLEIKESELIWQPQSKVMIGDKAQAERVINFLEALEDDDDVQKVHTNLDIDQNVLTELAAG
ncbi:MAG: YebC/PmpR family DNA-binding transcriptional regulator [SAR324 cluster bacterium]|nr:YebC/PmpR family DNA-binding transcriptional regulator [SAR324 cluster bacterium]